LSKPGRDFFSRASRVDRIGKIAQEHGPTNKYTELKKPPTTDSQERYKRNAS
jgi:hypothetical protein